MFVNTKEVSGVLLIIVVLHWTVFAYPPPPFARDGYYAPYLSRTNTRHSLHGIQGYHNIPDGTLRHLSHGRSHFHDTEIRNSDDDDGNDDDDDDDDDSYRKPRVSHKAYGRKTKYTLKHPNSRGQTKVTEMHVEMNREMHPHEAEHTMKKIMTSMGDNRSNFKNFVKNMGFSF